MPRLTLSRPFATVPTTAALAIVVALAIANVAGAAAREDATERGLTWLSRAWAEPIPPATAPAPQSRPANPAAPDHPRAQRPPAAAPSQHANVAVASLSGLALLAGGAQPGHVDDRSKALTHCLDYVAGRVDERGLIVAEGGYGGPMYGQGFATFFLAEAYGKTHDPALRAKLHKALRLIETSQNGQGGWRYMPAPMDADVSVTACEVVALEAGRRAGLDVDRDVIDRGLEYIRQCQQSDGGFAYMAAQAAGGSGMPRSAAAFAALVHGTGGGGGAVAEADANVRAQRRATEYLEPQLDPKANPASGHQWYANYYAAQALYLGALDAGRDKLYPALRDRLIAMQVTDGSWTGDFSDEYATAMALIALQVPDGRLAMFKDRSK